MNGMPTTCCSHIGQLLIVAGNATWLAHNKWKHWLSLLTKLLWELLLKNWTAGFQNIPFSQFLVFPISTFAKMQCISFSVVEFLDMQWENALKHWCYHSNCMGRRSLKDKVSVIWNKMQHHYTLLGVENKLPLLKATMFINTDRPHQEKPFLKVKAGECKSLVHVFAHLAVDFHTGDDISNAILALCESMAEFTDLMDSSSRHPTDAQCARAEEIMSSFMAQYKFLQLHRPTDFMWHTVIKFHTAKHLAASFKLGNPKFSWCFKSEDYCGRIARLAHSCSFGCKALALATKIAEKYRLMMFIRQWQFNVWKRMQVKEERYSDMWT